MERVIVDVHPEDGYYEVKNKYIGRSIIPSPNCSKYPDDEINRRDNTVGWESGACRYKDEGGDYFFAVKTRPVQEGKKGEEKSTSTIPYGNLYKRKLRMPRT